MSENRNLEGSLAVSDVSGPRPETFFYDWENDDEYTNRLIYIAVESDRLMPAEVVLQELDCIFLLHPVIDAVQTRKAEEINRERIARVDAFLHRAG